jgi:hypothetical protein
LSLLHVLQGDDIIFNLAGDGRGSHLEPRGYLGDVSLVVDAGLDNHSIVNRESSTFFHFSSLSKQRRQENYKTIIKRCLLR